MAVSISAGGAPQVLQSEGHLVLDGERAELGVGILKDQPGLLGEQVHRIVAHHQPGHRHPARVVALHQMGDQPVQTERQRALARAAGPEHQHRLPRVDREGEVASAGFSRVE